MQLHPLTLEDCELLEESRANVADLAQVALMQTLFQASIQHQENEIHVGQWVQD